MRDDYYRLLEVELTATPHDIKASYRRLALRYHPDRNDGDELAEEKFKLVSEAYRTLGVPERRREYDNWLRLHNLYHDAPELAPASPGSRPAPRHVHISARRGQERREARAAGRRRAVRRSKGTLVRHSTKVNRWLFIGFYVFIGINLLPIFVRYFRSSSPSQATPSASAKAADESSEAEKWTRVLDLERRLREAAAAGNAESQYQLALFLFNKSSVQREEGKNPGLMRRAAAQAIRHESLEWLDKAAAQGHVGAGRMLRGLEQASEH